MKYHVYIQGFNEDDSINDYTQEVATFNDRLYADWFVENYCFESITIPLNQTTPHAKVILEKRTDNDEFVSVEKEREIF